MAEPIIELRDVSFHVPGRRILDGVNLRVESGEICCVMGGSGSGKTTLLRIIVGLVRPTSGEVLIEGRDITGLSEQELNQVRKRIGFVFQYSALFDSLTVWENVEFGLLRDRRPRQEIDRIVQEKLEAVGLRGIDSLYPAQLSGGMRKRVGMARALAMEPPIVLYDEPTSGLDPVTVALTDTLIMKLRDRFQNTAIVVSHHLPSIFKIADRVAMLYDGGIRIFGTPEEVRQSSDPVVRQFVEGLPEGPITDQIYQREAEGVAQA